MSQRVTNGSLPFDRTVKQTAETMSLAPKTITTTTPRQQIDLQAYKSC